MLHPLQAVVSTRYLKILFTSFQCGRLEYDSVGLKGQIQRQYHTEYTPCTSHSRSVLVLNMHHLSLSSSVFKQHSQLTPCFLANDATKCFVPCMLKCSKTSFMYISFESRFILINSIGLFNPKHAQHIADIF